MTAPGNAELAEQARDYARQHPPGSLGRRAWLCASVALATTNTLTGARRALAGVQLDDVRTAAARALNTLTATPPAETGPETRP